MVSHLHVHEHPEHVAPAPGLKAVKVERKVSYGGLAYVRFSALSEWAVRVFKLRRRIQVADMAIPPEGYAGLAVQRSVLVGLLSVPLAAILSLLTGSLLPLAMLAVPIVFFLSSMYYPSVVASGRAEGVSSELPFLSTYLAMAVSARVPFFKALEHIGTEPNPLTMTSREVMNLRGDTEWFIKDEELAAEKMSGQHPNQAFRTWLAGLLHVLRMGGDIVAHLDEAMDKTLTDLEEAWDRYVGHASSVGTVTAILYAMLPITIYVFLLITVNPSTIAIAFAYTFLISPLGAVMMILLAEAGRPKIPVTYSGYYRILAFSAVPAVLVGLVANFAGLESYSVVAISIILCCLPAALKYEYDWSGEGSIESNLPRLLTDITENRRVGQDVDTAFSHVAFHHRYGRALDAIVDLVAFNIHNFAVTVSNALGAVKIRSWHSRSIFFLLREATESGGGEYTVFERLRKFADRYVALRKRVVRDLFGYQLLFYSVAVVIVASTLFIDKFVLTPQTGLLGSLTTTGAPTGMLTTQANLNAMEAIALTGAVVNGGLLGLISGKIGRGTIAGAATNVVIGVSIALISILVLSALLVNFAGFFPTLMPT